MRPEEIDELVRTMNQPKIVRKFAEEENYRLVPTLKGGTDHRLPWTVIPAVPWMQACR
jgi:hypothetical protein